MTAFAAAVTGYQRLFLVFLVVFTAFWLWFLVPFLWHCIRALRAGNAWLPFEPKANGRYTFMAQGRRLAAFRAPRNRTTIGLLWRYGTWTAVVIALTLLPLQALRALLDAPPS